MAIFVGAALAGFLLFGWIKASPPVLKVFQKSWIQGVLGLLALAVLVWSVWGLITLPTLEAVQTAQDLTGPEVVQLILGAIFGCVLRYWGSQFWVVRMPPGTRYNWVAISLVGLLLLAAAVPYIGSLLRDWGMTGLKTPFAEFQFAGKTTTERVAFEVESKARDITLVPAFSMTGIGHDLSWLLLKKTPTRDEPSANKMTEKNNDSIIATYQKTKDFIHYFLRPLSNCAFEAYENGLDPESIRHALGPVAQQLRLLIEPGQSQNSTPVEKLSVNNLLTKIKDSVNSLKEAFVQDEDLPLQDVEEIKKSVNRLKNMCLLGNLKSIPSPDVLAKTPHIYLALARLDRYNGNMDRAIAILESASEKFDADRTHGPGIRLFLNIFLANFLHEEEHDPGNIFPYLDRALEIAQNTRRKIEKWEESSRNFDKDELLKVKGQLEAYERGAKNALAFFSAKTGGRKFMALRYAEENYDDRNKLRNRANKPDVIDTYGYVKMAFAKRSNPPDFDEIKQAKALFQEALAYLKILPADSRLGENWKHEMKVKLQAHLKQTDRILESQ